MAVLVLDSRETELRENKSLGSQSSPRSQSKYSSSTCTGDSICVCVSVYVYKYAIVDFSINKSAYNLQITNEVRALATDAVLTCA